MKGRKPFTIRLSKIEPNLVRLIRKKHPELTKEEIEERFRYNIVRSAHLSDVTGKRPDAIMTLSRVELKDGKPFSKLDRVTPFTLKGEQDSTKVVFIEFNDKCREFIRECNA